VSIEKSLYSALIADGTVSGIIGAKVYPVGAVPTEVNYPFVSYSRISTRRWNTLGTSGTGEISGTQAANIQINCAAESYGAAKTLASAVYSVLAARGDQFIEELDLYGDDAGQSGAFTVMLEFSIWE
jgi:hypothetical protein